MRYFAVLLFILTFLSSCNTFKVIDNQMNRKMDKALLSRLQWVDSTTQDTIEYWDGGVSEKPVMVIVHGFGASTKFQWSKQVKMLSEHYRLVMPNLNCFGKTRLKEKRYRVGDQIQLIKDLLEHLELKEFSLMGVSYGGLISAELAQSNRYNIDHVIIFDAPIKYMDESDLKSVKNSFEVESIEELFVPSHPEGLKKLLYLATGKKSHIPTSMLRGFHENTYANNSEDKRKLITHLLKDMALYQKSEYIFQMPVLLIWGENDLVVSTDVAEQLKKDWGTNVRLEIIEGAAHMPNMTHKRKFNQIVHDFLDLD